MQEQTTGLPTKPDIKIEKSEYSTIPGRRIEIPFRVVNKGGRDIFEIDIKGVPDNWATLSKQAVELAPDESTQIILTILPSQKAQTDFYPVRVSVASQSDPRQVVQSDINLRVAVVDTEGRIGVTMDSITYSVSPGQSVDIPIHLDNRGSETDNLRLRVEGLPTNWISAQTPTINLKPGEKKVNKLLIHPPRHPGSKAGRHTFTLKIASQLAPEDTVEVDCILTITAFSEFRVGLQPVEAPEKEPVQLLVENLGNVNQTFDISWRSAQNDLVFQTISADHEGTREDEKVDAEVADSSLHESHDLRVASGQTGSLKFQAQPISRAILGGETAHAYAAAAKPAGQSQARTLTVQGQIVSRALIPTWVFATMLVIVLGLGCMLAVMVGMDLRQTASATQTAAYGTALVEGATQTSAANQTAAVAQGQQDLDGDGLTDDEETQFGTDPQAFDTDGDGLGDGNEVNETGTDPLNPDSDEDALTDGDEVLRRSTNPLSPDTDGDGLLDGDEVQRGTDPLVLDTDQDGLSDGDEIQAGTDPLNPDSDNDGLLDGQETPPCPDPLNPDSDADGTIDNRDLDPCDANNPALTATAIAAQPPTATPTEMVPTETPAQATSTPVVLPGAIAFQSNRSGNPDIFLQNGADGVITQLTTHPEVDTQPALSPDRSRIAFTSNRDGDNEIYIMNIDGSNIINVTNDSADDQFPTWSPDGQWIAFASLRDGNWDIYVVPLDGFAAVRLTNHPDDDLHPAWYSSGGPQNPQGRIAFTTNRDGNQEIYTMESSGTNQINLTNSPSDDFYPAPSKDGANIAFVSNRDGNNDIFIMSANGDSPFNLTNDPAEDLYPSWSPDGNWVAFAANRGNPEIFAIRTDSSLLVNLTNNPATDDIPSWR